MKVKVQQGREEINSIGGISLIGGLFNSLKSLKKVDLMRMTKVKTGKIKHSGILKTIAGLFALGKNDYADIEPFRKDAFFRDCLKLPAVPSEETLRQRIDELARAQEIPGVIQFSNVEMLKKVPYFGTEKTAHGEYIPLDIDVSPLDNSGSKKEGVSWTYKNHDGYAPIFAYLGTHGYMLNCELRPGSQHSNKDALEFIRYSLDMIDPNIMYEAGKMYVIRRSPSWNLRPNTPVGSPAPKKRINPLKLKFENMKKQQDLVAVRNKIAEKIGIELLEIRKELQATNEKKITKDLLSDIKQIKESQGKVKRKMAELEQ